MASMNTWVWHPAFKIADDFQASLKKADSAGDGRSLLPTGK